MLGVSVLALGLLELPVFLSHRRDHFVDVYRLQDFHLTLHVFQVIQSLHLGCLELLQLVLLDLLEFHLVAEPVEHLVLGGHLVLYFHQLLLQDLLPFLGLG